MKELFSPTPFFSYGPRSNDEKSASYELTLDVGDLNEIFQCHQWSGTMQCNAMQCTVINRRNLTEILQLSTLRCVALNPTNLT